MENEVKKYWALRSGEIKNEQIVDTGYLVFINEKKYLGFLDMTKNSKRKECSGHYTEIGEVNVSPFVADFVEKKGIFFVNDLML